MEIPASISSRMPFYQHQCLLQYPSFQAQEACLNLAFLQSSELASMLLHFARADPSHSRMPAACKWTAKQSLAFFLWNTFK